MRQALATTDSDEFGDEGGAAGNAPGRFALNLEFAGSTCPSCGEVCEPGRCPSCGGAVPGPNKPDELVSARRKALGPFAEESAALVESFDEIRTGSVPLSVDQFVACVEDVSLFDRAAALGGLGHELGALDLNDPKVIGSQARRVVGEAVRKVAELRETAVELCTFAPEGPAAELQEIAVEAGRHGARVVDALLRFVTATAPSEAATPQEELLELLGEFPAVERLDALQPMLAEWSTPNDDARIASVLGRSGEYTDEFGLLIPTQVFAAYSDADEPFAALGEAASRYFERSLGLASVVESGAAAILILPAVSMAVLDRPLVAHRVARRFHELLAEAWARDPDAVVDLVKAGADEAPAILSAASRVQKGFRLLMFGMEGGEADEESAAAQALSAYLEIVESAYRTFGWMVLNLERVVRGEALSSGSEAPTLGQLEQLLGAAADPAARAFAAASDSELRNAVAHSQYRWDDASQEIHDLKTGRRWDADLLDERMAAMVGAVTGADASWACFVIARDLDIEPPQWASDASGTDAVSLVAGLSFGSRGFAVHSVRDGGATVVLDPPRTIDPSELVPPLAGMSVIATEVETYRILSSADNSPLLEVDAGVIRSAREAGDEIKDVAVLETALSAMVHSGRDRVAATTEIAALMVKLVAVTAMQDLVADQGPASFERARVRFAYARELPARWHASSRELDEMRELIDSAAASVDAAEKDQRAWLRAGEELPRLVEWAEAQGVRWPPRLETASA